MNYQFKDIAHFYLGCKGTFENHIKGPQHPDTMGVDTFEDVLNGNYAAGFKPILIPLVSMNEYQKRNFRLKCEKTKTDNILPRISAGPLIEWFHTERSVVVTIWLLQNHFDLFGLIESGEAIDATKLNPNPYQ